MKTKVMKITGIKYVPIGNLNSLPRITTVVMVDRPENERGTAQERRVDAQDKNSENSRTDEGNGYP